MSSQNNNSLKYSLIGAACAAGLGLASYYFYMKSLTNGSKVNSNVKNLSKITTIKVLKQLKKEFFTSFTTMSMMAQQIKQQARGQIGDAEVKEYVLMHPQINDEFKASEQRAYQRHKVLEEEFQNAVDHLFKEDPEVQQHRAELKAMFDKSASGAQLDMKTEIPQSLTSLNTLQIIEQVMKASCKKIQEVFAQLKEDNGGEINMNDPQTIQALNSMRIDDIKAKILQEHGLDQYDDAGSKILQYATQKYSMDNVEGFTEKMMALEIKHRKAMELIQQNPSDPNLVERTFAEEVQAPPMGGFGGMQMGPRGMRRPPAGQSASNVVVGDKIQRDEEKPAATEAKTEEVKQEQQAEQKTEQKVEQQQEQQAEQQVEQQPEQQVEQQQEQQVEQQQEQPQQQSQEEVVVIQQQEEVTQQPQEQLQAQQE